MYVARVASLSFASKTPFEPGVPQGLGPLRPAREPEPTGDEAGTCAENFS